MRAIQVTEFGGPETLVLREVPDPVPGAGQRVYPVRTAGVNFADTHQTENSYLAAQSLPLIPGTEVVVADESGRRWLGLIGSGGYAELVALAPGALFPVPDEVGDAAALTALVQGATAWHLLRTSTHLAAGETVVVHAGAGGVGSLAIQLARRWDAGRIIATASSPAKQQLCLDLGADVALDADHPELAAVLREANDGNGVDIVLEMIGGTVFDQSLQALAPFGRLATFGMAGRVPPTPIQARMLMARSTSVVGFWLAHLMHRPEALAAAITDLLAMIAADAIRPVLGGSFPLERAADAHRALRSRGTVGKLVLTMAS